MPMGAQAQARDEGNAGRRVVSLDGTKVPASLRNASSCRLTNEAALLLRA